MAAEIGGARHVDETGSPVRAGNHAPNPAADPTPPGNAVSTRLRHWSVTPGWRLGGSAPGGPGGAGATSAARPPGTSMRSLGLGPAASCTGNGFSVSLDIGDDAQAALVEMWRRPGWARPGGSCGYSRAVQEGARRRGPPRPITAAETDGAAGRVCRRRSVKLAHSTTRAGEGQTCDPRAERQFDCAYLTYHVRMGGFIVQSLGHMVRAGKRPLDAAAGAEEFISWRIIPGKTVLIAGAPKNLNLLARDPRSTWRAVRGDH